MKNVKKIITSHVARNGEVSIFCCRLYAENRISYEKYKEAVRKGMEIYKRKNDDK